MPESNSEQPVTNPKREITIEELDEITHLIFSRGGERIAGLSKFVFNFNGEPVIFYTEKDEKEQLHTYQVSNEGFIERLRGDEVGSVEPRQDAQTS
ncbi:hypothetical protein A3F00_01590 [Candidatus Daviesbacteria bacterium RIFCSPHIGHO2_12_FULL_37_11]|uniref:Uncharacterized protein n=1 Tax=Candidatus Daviesbacteria bacterium RIFCSPHIGHO2_12_FULL_37_11 TaxID=1797777 RepID=A0A1F5KCA1_9BACT|nr:MAG: hypothetical protein A2111_01270 [Candidatus Daviesbacteria bacterium GWA1_38_6]OGE16472.1 MAG: hypothetical protein A2769_02235 [Candidatus Daviesbacteria bacterium RIFCSPHIGHO2_01_FULL_37_27]OGE38567.1 MAG: hypothetical protein A3F00_01590 [Candidatus Daviesbacteria bacterium RIFCSPHIGHO2_12_FULL_37_11]OGE46278.1 MAG: hypothetical protein A3B39_03815 [Candidatus Daviesbacteria bacterium RIFCSPLOWO2_01_FULL_37_10]